jgi:hypothetical protein
MTRWTALLVCRRRGTAAADCRFGSRQARNRSLAAVARRRRRWLVVRRGTSASRTWQKGRRDIARRPVTLYIVTMVNIERTQTGLRIERNTLKVLKALAEYLDLSLGDLVEGIVLHAFDGLAPFSSPVLAKIEQLKAVYGLTLTAADAHKLTEGE